MIRLPRKAAPAVLAAKDCAGRRETLQAIAFFRARPPRRAAFTFQAYKHQSVRAALNAMSHFKCAYCESSYGATQPVDIEHYRPKGTFSDENGRRHPGYYWLAATWSNLLPSCIDCNRRRMHGAAGVMHGKGMLFPIRGRRARKPGAERHERRLLLQPRIDHPERHLWFTADGGVVARRTSRGVSLKGRTSIAVYGLTRPELVCERARYARFIHFDIEATLRAIEVLSEDQGSHTKRTLVMLQLQKLRERLSPTLPYTALSRQLILPILTELGLPADVKSGA